MFRDIRKKKNQISTEAAEQLLREARRGILAVNGREGYPYAIPINYYYDREAQKIYFHGARAGHKAGIHAAPVDIVQYYLVGAGVGIAEIAGLLRPFPLPAHK